MLGVAAGISDLDETEIQWMREAHIGWLRSGNLKFDVEAFLSGRNQGPAFRETMDRIRSLRAKGFQIVGLTPGPRELADRAGEPGSPAYYAAYRRICAFLAESFRGLIDWWQVANELDIWLFREKLSMEQSVELLKAGIRGMKEAVPELKVGINITLFPSLPGEVDGNTDLHEGIVLAKGIYGDPDLPVDYAGFDSYPGTWRKGGPESWHEYLDGFHRLTGKPILIQEFGYSSAGGVMTEEEDKSGIFPCKAKKWRFSWKGAHTREIQAEFIRESFRIFAGKPHVIGAIYFSWQDSKRCWQCGEPDCPAETAWGLLDSTGNKKLSYEGFRSGAEDYLAGAVVPGKAAL